MRIDLPAYLPDQSINSGVVTVAENVYRAADGYRPVGSFLSNSSALPAPFNGGGSFISTGGTSYLLAGTTTTLSRYSAGGWVSLLSGLTVANRWSFVQFGDFVIAANGGDTQEVDLNAGTASDLTGAPTFAAVNVVGDYVVGTQADGDTEDDAIRIWIGCGLGVRDWCGSAEREISVFAREIGCNRLLIEGRKGWRRILPHWTQIGDDLELML